MIECFYSFASMYKMIDLCIVSIKFFNSDEAIHSILRPERTLFLCTSFASTVLCRHEKFQRKKMSSMLLNFTYKMREANMNRIRRIFFHLFFNVNDDFVCLACVISSCCQKRKCLVEHQHLTQLSVECVEHLSKCLWLLSDRTENKRLTSVKRK